MYLEGGEIYKMIIEFCEESLKRSHLEYQRGDGKITLS
jgi:hypothetical protein